MEGIVYWITGLSGAGKTTIGRELYKQIKLVKDNVVLFDGDELREAFGNDLGYSKADRLKCAMRYANLCKLLSSQGIDVICCTISMYEDVRKWNRDQIKQYKEIYVKVPLEILKKRNRKNLYISAEKGEENVAGINLEIELPTQPDIIIDNIGDELPEKIAKKLFIEIN